MCFVLFVGVNSVWNLNGVGINMGDIKADSFHSVTHLPGCLFVSLSEDLMQLLLPPHIAAECQISALMCMDGKRLRSLSRGPQISFAQATYAGLVLRAPVIE